MDDGPPCVLGSSKENRVQDLVLEHEHGLTTLTHIAGSEGTESVALSM